MGLLRQYKPQLIDRSERVHWFGCYTIFENPFVTRIRQFFSLFLSLSKLHERTISSWNIIYKFQRKIWENYSLIPSFKGNFPGFDGNGEHKPAQFPVLFFINHQKEW